MDVEDIMRPYKKVVLSGEARMECLFRFPRSVRERSLVVMKERGSSRWGGLLRTRQGGRIPLFLGSTWSCQPSAGAVAPRDTICF